MDNDRNLAERSLARAAGAWEGARSKTGQGWDATRRMGARLWKSPLGAIARMILGIASWWHRRIWSRWAYRKGRFVNWQAALVIGASLFVVWATPTVMGWTARAILMATTIHTERVQLTISQEIDEENDIHSIKGCSSFPCDNSQAVYYRVQRNLPHDVYAWWTRDERFYPEEVASVVTPGVNDCEVVSYGLRIRALRRGWGIYPNLLHAVCTPVINAQGAS